MCFNCVSNYMSHHCVTKFAFMMTDTAITVLMHNFSWSHLGLHYFSPNMVPQEADTNGLKITQAKPVLTSSTVTLKRL